MLAALEGGCFYSRSSCRGVGRGRQPGSVGCSGARGAGCVAGGGEKLPRDNGSQGTHRRKCGYWPEMGLSASQCCTSTGTGAGNGGLPAGPHQLLPLPRPPPGCKATRCCCSWTWRGREPIYSADHQDLPGASACEREETRSLVPLLPSCQRQR